MRKPKKCECGSSYSGLPGGACENCMNTGWEQGYTPEQYKKDKTFKVTVTRIAIPKGYTYVEITKQPRSSKSSQEVITQRVRDKYIYV